MARDRRGASARQRSRRWLVEMKLARGALGRFAGCPAMGFGCTLRLGKFAQGAMEWSSG